MTNLDKELQPVLDKLIGEETDGLVAQQRSQLPVAIAVLKQLIYKESEVYAPVRGYEGLYEVSNLGNVKSLKGGRRKGGLLKPTDSGIGYMRVWLCKDGASRCTFIHRLVAEAFLSNPENKPTVNHKDGKRANNHISNLEWATHSENEQHSRKVLGKRTWNYGRKGVPAYWKNSEIEDRLSKTNKCLYCGIEIPSSKKYCCRNHIARYYYWRDKNRKTELNNAIKNGGAE